MNRTAVTSSNIRSIGFEPESETLEVEFKSGGLYQYANVPKSLFDRFMAASSKGRFFDQYVRDKFRTRKIR
jgi:hypothetical protein